MSRPSQNYPPEMRERAVRMVAEVRENYPSEAAAI
jgi:transposase